MAEYLKSVRARHNAEDHAILQGYKALARGKTIVDLPKCIRLGGVFQDGSTQQGLPRVAIATASHEFVWVERTRDGAVVYRPGVVASWGPNRISHQRRKDVYRCPVGTLTSDAPEVYDSRIHRSPWSSGTYRAMVPHVPPSLRPAHALDNYAVLFEVEEWAADPTAPRDPALLKHIGGDLYAVLATWDLTPLEQSVLNGRLG